MLLVMLIGCTLLPLLPSMDIRGWHEMHPLDGPAWSLFFEYIANILYAAGIRKLSNKALGIFVLLSAGLLVHLAMASPHGDVIGGWSIDRKQLHIGFARLLYPFFAGVLLMRTGKRIHVRRTHRRKLPDQAFQAVGRYLLSTVHNALSADLHLHCLDNPGQSSCRT